MLPFIRSAVDAIRRFGGSREGNLAVTFTLAIVPVIVATGATIDYGRMATAKTELQNAADVIALTIARDIEAGKTEQQIRRDINNIFKAEMDVKALNSWTVDYTYNPKTWVVSVSASAEFDSVMLDVVGIKDLRIGALSEATYGTDYVEIALVLDNTGSMNSASKLTSLKTAANSMIDKLSLSQAGIDGKVKVAVIPFGVTVNVGVGNDSATWLGPKGTYQSCSGWGWGWGWNCTTVTKTWTGCVGDRVSPYTTTGTAPSTGTPATLYPRDYDHCTTSSILPLTSNFAAAKLKITSMTAGGNTNVPIGAMWGWNMLVEGAPLSTAETSTTVKKVLKYAIVLTDGENTQNSLGQSVSTIDSNTTSVCTGIKNAGITVFTIRVIDGNETLLRNCATTPDYYYDVSNPSTLTGVFEKILMNITKLRLSS
jgi:Flp pilus assembly protein TadG